MNNTLSPHESRSVTTEAASCAAKDDTEVEVVTHLLNSLSLCPSGTCSRSYTALHNNVTKNGITTHTSMQKVNCATIKKRTSRLKITLRSSPSGRRTTTLNFTSHKSSVKLRMQLRVCFLNCVWTLKIHMPWWTCTPMKELCASVFQMGFFFITTDGQETTYGRLVIKQKKKKKPHLIQPSSTFFSVLPPPFFYHSILLLHHLSRVASGSC